MAGQTEYHRIIDRNSQFGVTHIVYEPRNTLRASRFNSTDGWGWEASLWFSMGQQVHFILMARSLRVVQIRTGEWAPGRDPVPQEIKDMVAYAASKNVKLMAYVYPCLAFQAIPSALIGENANLANEAYRDYMLETLSTFMSVTGAGGFAWDHNIYAGPQTLQYAQWRAWMYILGTLRQRFPDMVMDHRQTAHLWGPWYQLAVEARHR